MNIMILYIKICRDLYYNYIILLVFNIASKLLSYNYKFVYYLQRKAVDNDFMVTSQKLLSYLETLKQNAMLHSYISNKVDSIIPLMLFMLIYTFLLLFSFHTTVNV